MKNWNRFASPRREAHHCVQIDSEERRHPRCQRYDRQTPSAEGLLGVGVSQFQVDCTAWLDFDGQLVHRRLFEQTRQVHRSLVTEFMPVLRVPRVNEQIQLPVAHEVQLEGFVPVEHQVAGAHHRARFVHPVALQHAVQVSQAAASCNFPANRYIRVDLRRAK